jgi:hypothetical protein
MLDSDANQKSENTDPLGFARFGGLDRLDWLMIVVSVLLGTVAKQHHVLDLPDWFLITELVQSRRERGKNTNEK